MKLGKKLAAFGLSVSALALGFAGVASAHVTVKPGEVLTGAFQTFNVSVPVEKGVGTTSIKLDIPEGLSFVTPSVKPGWTIRVKKQGQGEAGVVKFIIWSGNQIAPGFRDDFTFSAKVPDKPAELHWNALQTYADGSTVAWNVAEDQQPKKADGSPDFSKSGPFSVTKVMSETAGETASKQTDANAHSAETAANWALYLAIGGILLGFTAVFLASRRKV